MGNPITQRGLLSPPRSPSQKPGKRPALPTTSNSPNLFPPTPDRTNTDGRARAPNDIYAAGTSSATVLGKRPVRRDGDSPPDQPPTRKPRIDTSSSSSSLPKLDLDLEDGNKVVPADRGLSSLPFMSDPLLACLVSIQTGITACTANLMLRRAADQGNNGLLTELITQQEAKLKENYQSITDFPILRSAHTVENGYYQRLEYELEAEKKKSSELNLQLSELKEKLRNPNQLKQLFKQTSAYKELEDEFINMGYRSCWNVVAKHMPRADLSFLQRYQDQRERKAVPDTTNSSID